MRFRFWSATVLLFALAAAAQEQRKPVRVGVGLSVPWAYLSPDGAPTGFYVEVMTEAARRENLPLEIVFRPDGPERSLVAGAIDLWAAAVPTPERRQRLHFTSPWWSQDHYIAIRQDRDYSSLSDLAGRTILYAPSPPFTMPLEQAIPGANFQPLGDLRARFHSLCAGQADAVLFYHETALFAITGSNELADCRERGLRIVPLGRSVMEVSVVSLPEKRELAERFRTRIAAMQLDGTLTRLGANPLTGNESFSRLIRAGEDEHLHRLLEISVVFLLLLLAISSVAYFRLRRANRRAAEALALAEHASRAKTEFLATMSHEIRTPMTAVLGYMDLLMHTPLRHDQRRFAAEVTHATESLLTVISTILGYARPGRAAAPPENEAIDVAAVVDDCVAAVMLEAEEKGLSLQVRIDPGVPRRVQGSAVGLRQAILNLTVNAVKFTSRGSVRIYVSYGGAELTCIVSDSGEGIPEEKRRIIFDPFTQVESSDDRCHGGVGLGLAVVAEFCRQANGAITVTDNEGGGARFTLRVPYRPVPGDPGWLGDRVAGTAAVIAPSDPNIETLLYYLRHAGLAVSHFSSVDDFLPWLRTAPSPLIIFATESVARRLPRNPAKLILIGSLSALRAVPEMLIQTVNDILPLPAAACALREILLPPASPVDRPPVQVRRRVLVVDDNPVNRRVLSALLEKLNCRVDTARNGREAVEAAQREPYTVIFMDCQMPVMNGYDAAAEICRSVRSGAPIPICGISASFDADTRRRCEAAGMSEYLPKPVTIESLQEILTRVSARQIIVENLQRPS